MAAEIVLPLAKPAALEFANEDQLLAACRRGELRAFEHLFHEHAPRLKSIALQMLGNRPDAEDAVQEAFLKACRGIRGFQGHSSAGTWLCRILINTCYDLLRSRPRHPAGDSPPQPMGERPSLPMRLALRDAVERLNPNHRMVFRLHEVEGYRHGEIASILQIPEGTSKAWLFEAKRELKRMLGEAR